MYTMTDTIPFSSLRSKDLRALLLATSQANYSDMDSHRLGACIRIKGGNYILGENQKCRKRIGRYNWYSLHAEMNALYKSLKIRRKNFRSKKNTHPPSVIYVVRILKDQDLAPDDQDYLYGNSKPCENCEERLFRYNVRRIYYTDYQDGENVLCELRMN